MCDGYWIRRHCTFCGRQLAWTYRITRNCGCNRLKPGVPIYSQGYYGCVHCCGRGYPY